MSMKKFKDKKIGLIVVVVIKLVAACGWTPGRGSDWRGNSQLVHNFKPI